MKGSTVKRFKVSKDAEWCLLGFCFSVRQLYASRNHSSKSKEIRHPFRNPPKKTSLWCVQKLQKQSNTMQTPLFTATPQVMWPSYCDRHLGRNRQCRSTGRLHTHTASLSWEKERLSATCPSQQFVSRSAESLVHDREPEEKTPLWKLTPRHSWSLFTVPQNVVLHKKLPYPKLGKWKAAQTRWGTYYSYSSSCKHCKIKIRFLIWRSTVFWLSLFSRNKKDSRF